MPVARRRRVGQAAEVLTYAPLIGPLVGFLTVDKGPWPAPRVDAIDALAAKYAADWPAWGHRKVAAMMRADGHAVSTSTVQRALRRRGCCCRAGTGLTANRGRYFVGASFMTNRAPHLPTRTGTEPTEGALADGGHPRAAVGAENLVVGPPRTVVG